MKKYVSLEENEELIIGSGPNKKSISVKNVDNILHISEIKPRYKKDNVEITEIDFNDLKSFVLFESYYQEITGSTDKKIDEMFNKILDYHYKKIYGKMYNKDYSNIKDTSFQVITTFE